MPKADKAMQQQKDADKARKKAAVDAQKEAKAEKQAAAEPVEEVPKTNGNGKNHASSFNKAAVDDSDDEPEAAAPAVIANAPTAAKAKKETAADRKKAQKEAQKDEMRLLVEEQRAAMKQRIVQRLLRVFLIGYLLEAKEKKDESGGKDANTKRKKAPGSGGRSVKDEDSSWNLKGKIDQFAGPVLMLAFIVLIIGSRMAEEGYSPDFQDGGENYYDVMGIERGSGLIEIKKAYKSLALTIHPDKNPDCVECPEKFAKISKAYETLGDNDKRKSYDAKKAPKGDLTAASSVELTAENFEHMVKRSNEVWFVQVFDPSDGLCKDFHPVWEETSLSHQHLAKFGRIDVSLNKEALIHLPQRIRTSGPLVFRFARGELPETFVWSGKQDSQGATLFTHFVLDRFPELPKIEEASAVKTWWAAADRPKLLVAGPLNAPRRQKQAMQLLAVQRIFHVWSEFIDFGAAEGKMVRGALGAEFAPEATAMGDWVVSYKNGAHTETVSLNGIEEIAGALQPLVKKALSNQAPAVTVRNFHQLCDGGDTRHYCLVLVNPSDGGKKALSELKESSTAYTQELKDMAESSGDEAQAEEQAFHIQAVRLHTSTSRSYTQPVAAGAGFSALWKEAKYTPAFVIETEGRRLASWKPKDVKELYQQIAYEDLKFSELPDYAPISYAMPDPEIPLKQMTKRLLGSPVGGIFAFVVVAFAIAVLPELELLHAGISVGAFATLVTLVWPYAFRRVTLAVGCLVSSKFECQVLVGA